MPSFIRRILGRRNPHPSSEWNGPFHVWCVAPRVVRIHGQCFASHEAREDHDGRLYVLRGLTPLHLLGRSDQILVSHEFGEVLTRTCPNDVELARADLLDVATGKQLNGYGELRVCDQVTREDILRVRDLSPRAWRYEVGGRNLFVTKPVVHAIENAGIYGLCFSPGLSAFFD